MPTKEERKSRVEARFRLLLAIYLIALILLLAGTLLSLLSGAPLAWVFFGVCLLGSIVCVAFLRASVALFVDSTMTRSMLTWWDKHEPQIPDDYLAESRLLLRSVAQQAAKTRMALTFTEPHRHIRELRQRITSDLDAFEVALGELATAYQLGGDALLERFAQRNTLKIAQSANRQLARCQAALPQAVAEQASQQPGPALFTAVEALCLSMSLNPLNVEAFATGGKLMAELHRDDLADLSQALSRHLSEVMARQVGIIREIVGRYTRDAPDQ